MTVATDGAAAGRRVLGLDRAEWARKLIGWAAALAVASAAWWLSVRDGLAARPTEDEARAIIQSEISVHREHASPHPDIRDQLRQLRETQSEIRDAVREQGAQLRAVRETLDDLRADMRRSRRNR